MCTWHLDALCQMAVTVTIILKWLLHQHFIMHPFYSTFEMADSHWIGGSRICFYISIHILNGTAQQPHNDSSWVVQSKQHSFQTIDDLFFVDRLSVDLFPSYKIGWCWNNVRNNFLVVIKSDVNLLNWTAKFVNWAEDIETEIFGW